MGGNGEKKEIEKQKGKNRRGSDMGGNKDKMEAGGIVRSVKRKGERVWIGHGRIRIGGK